MPETNSQPDRPTQLLFTYQKSNYFRMVHVDGVHGGIGPTGRYIHMSAFSERRTLPKEHLHLIGADGTLESEPVQTVDIGGVFREVECCLVMDIAVAAVIHNWLGQKLAEHKELLDATKRLRESAAADQSKPTE